MKLQKHKQLLRGVAATAAALLTLSTVAYGVAKSDLAIGWVDGFFGINDRTIYKDWVEKVEDTVIEGEPGWVNLPGRPHQMDHDTVDAYAEALRAHAIRQGEEGFALLKNDNDALPLNKSAAGSNCRSSRRSGRAAPCSTIPRSSAAASAWSPSARATR